MLRNRLRPASMPVASRARRALYGLALVGVALSTVGAVHAQDSAGAPALQSPMSVDWKFTSTAFENNPASPVISGDMVYFASGGRVHAVGLQTGATRWTYPTEGSMPSPIQATPTLSGGTLFLPGGDGLYALDASTGVLKYPAFHVTHGGVFTSPVVVGSNVYFGSSDGRLYGLNTTTGDPISTAWQKGLSLGTDMASDMASDSGMLYVLTANQMMHAVDAASGVQKWVARVEGNVDGSIPVVAGDMIYLATQQVLTTWRASTGQQQWVLTTHSEITAPPAVAADGTIYIATSNDSIYALDARRQPIWKQVPHVDYDVVTQPVIAGDLLIVGTVEGGIYAFDRATGDLKWNYALQPSGLDPTRVPEVARVSDRPIASEGRLFVLTDDGTLTTFRHDAPDTIAPLVTDLAPEAGENCNGRPPFTVRAHIADDGSGLDATSISLKLDDQMIPRRATQQEAIDKPGFTFDKDTGILEYTIYEGDTGRSRTLPDGHHTATIIAKDWKGNQQTKTWTFFIDDTLPAQKAQQVANRNRNGRSGPGGGKGSGAPGGGSNPGDNSGDPGNVGGGAPGEGNGGEGGGGR